MDTAAAAATSMVEFGGGGEVADAATFISFFVVIAEHFIGREADWDADTGQVGGDVGYDFGRPDLPAAGESGTTT